MRIHAVAAAVLLIIPPALFGDEVDSQPPDAEAESGSPVDTFYQQVDIRRNPQFVVQGLNVSQQIHYQIASKFEVYAPDDKGSRKAVQTVTGAALVQADPLSYAVFTQSLAEMRGKTFTYKVDAFAEVISMEGHEDNTKVVDVPQPKSKGMLVSTVIDKDGWKELAQLTLFHPPKTGRSGRSFVRKTTHDWGSLGDWYGKTTFVGRTLGRTTKRFSYKHELEYIPPNKDAPKKGAALPFEINNAQFRAYEAWGEIKYDTRLGRVSAVREIFHARGTVGTTMLGVASNIEIDEKQLFTITITEDNPIRFDNSKRRSSK